ncbi:GNAT family N-acetyltransferase [Oricola sp.]|uniref:GNAT family N-acetyltransferase n=1 Tax=Oricola sp. TaxID=1979950 RepID=UPI003BA89F49
MNIANGWPPSGHRKTETSTPALLGEIGSLQVRLASDKSELEAAQRLRFKIFSAEMAATPDIAAPDSERDEDRYDLVCDHLVVIDRQLAGPSSERIVGTYRLLRGEVARNNGGFYSQSEFDVEAIAARYPERNILELGRSCVLPAYRGKRTIELLWQGIWAYCLQYRIDVMLGCASFPGTEPRNHALALSFLAHHAQACAAWNTRPTAADAVPMEMMPAEAIDLKAALSALPPLVKGYLRLGAKFADHAVIDRPFGSIDVLVVLPVEAISERYVRYYGADAGRFAAAG